MNKIKLNVCKPARPSKASQCREGKLKETLGPQDLYKIMQPMVANLAQEVAWSISLDCCGRVLSIDEIGRGTIDHVEVNPREVFRPAIENAAQYVVLAHFHPSDDVRPSDEDKALTRKMIKAGDILSVPCVDHLILGATKFTALSAHMPEFQFPELARLLVEPKKTKAKVDKAISDAIAASRTDES